MNIALELSLSLADYQKLMGLVGDPAVRPYWDATGTDHMGHPGDGVKGLEAFGNNIPMMHLKNGRAGFLMEQVHVLEKHPRSPVPERVMSIKWGDGAFPILKRPDTKVGSHLKPHIRVWRRLSLKPRRMSSS